jgi:MFS family permease
VARVAVTATVERSEAEDALRPRDGALVAERSIGDGRFEAAEGPFREYLRIVEAEPAADGRVRVTQRISFRLAVPYFGWLFVLPVRWALARGDRRSLWWAPPERLDGRAASALGTLAAVSVLGGYMAALLSTTIAFAGREFGADAGSQGIAGLVVRLGGILAVLGAALADRAGRRRVILGTALAAAVLTAAGAVAPSLPWLAAAQALARSLAVAMLIAVGITLAEEMPAGSRAYAVSLLAMAGSLGAGAVIVALPVADLGAAAWRWLYVVPLLGLALLPGIARHLPESRRFAAPHPEVSLPGHGRRLWLLAVSAFLVSLFASPSSFFGNRYLLDERGFNAFGITVLVLVTSLPGVIGVVAGGRLADTRGRRPVGAVALAVGLATTLLFYFSSGPALWAWSAIGALIGSAGIPALGVYGPELFPTSLRGRAGGLIAALGVLGSGIGIAGAGLLADRFGSLGPALAVLAPGPLLVAILVLVAYPETAHRELEDLNPEDRRTH